MSRVIVSNVGKHHAYETAIALQELGWLKRFYTSFYLERNPSQMHKLLRALLPKRLESKSSNRREERLNDDIVTSYFFPEILERTPLKNLMGAYNMMNLKGEIYDRRVAMQNLECDIFHGFEGAVLHSLRKAKRSGAKTVLDYPIFHYQTIRDIMVEEYKRFKVNAPKYLSTDDVNIRRKQKEIEESDFIFVPTERIAGDFIRYGKNKSQIKHIPYGFNPERFKAGEKQDSVFRIVVVGYLTFHKGIQYILQAFSELRLRNAELLIVSEIDNNFKPILAKYAGVFRHQHAIVQEELAKVYQNASVFVLPSLIEGFGMVTCEAMACGLPVIVTENCGMQPRDGKDGFIVPIRNPDALKEKILILYENENLRQQMGKSAAEYVKQFTWDNYHKNIQRVYQEIYQNHYA